MPSFDMKGRYSWELILNIDPTNRADFEREEIYKTSVYVNRKTFTSQLRETIASVNTSVSAGAVIKLLNVSTEIGSSLESITKLESTTETEYEYSEETTVTTTITIKAGQRCKFYQLIFTAPGVTQRMKTISTEPLPRDDVIINCSYEVTYFLKDIRVVYTSDGISKPDNSIEEVDGKSADVNAGFGGDFVWLVPEWTTDPSEGVTGISVSVQGTENSNYQDLAKGAGGDFRYLKMMRDSNSRERITLVKLWRTSNANHVQPPSRGWERYTSDINDGRDGDYLYICWEKFLV